MYVRDVCTVYVQACMCTCVRVCVRVHVRVVVRVCVRACICIQCVFARVCARSCVCMRACVWVDVAVGCGVRACVTMYGCV